MSKNIQDVVEWTIKFTVRGGVEKIVLTWITEKRDYDWQTTARQRNLSSIPWNWNKKLANKKTKK